jgi:hypothetical protein
MNFLLLHIVYKDLQSYKIHHDPQQTLSGTKQTTADIGENEIRFSREGGKKKPGYGLRPMIMFTFEE